jgi:hypothetical protein
MPSSFTSTHILSLLPFLQFAPLPSSLLFSLDLPGRNEKRKKKERMGREEFRFAEGIGMDR